MAVELQGRPFPEGYHSHGRALVCGVPLELPACRRTHGGTRGAVDHATIQRWVVKYSPQLEEAFHAASARCGSAGAWKCARRNL